jgi:hypothetical protein
VTRGAQRARSAALLYPICKRHKSRSWNLFIGDGWLYAIDLTADASKPKKRK